MHSEVMDFTPMHQNDIVEFSPSLDLALTLHETLPELSFLRNSDPNAQSENREYHFIHLTFQEYFAARYFVQRWKDDKPLEYVFRSRKHNAVTDPVSFLRTHKYEARYDVMWRFVAGLLDAEKEHEMLRFFTKLEEPPLDLLGPVHQRLVMHCLAEVSGGLKMRGDLEDRLSQWLLFECRFTTQSELATETEFPEEALSIAFREGKDVMATILMSLASRVHVPPRILLAITARLEDEDGDVRRAAIEAFQGQSSLPIEMVTAIAARLEHEDGDVRLAAIEALEGQSSLPIETTTAIAAGLEHEDRDVREAAIEVLQGQPSLPAETVTAIAARLEDEDWRVRQTAYSVRKLPRTSKLVYQ
ncbi:uncharacterized protein B0I36DRAFT_356598 [Microdochium trichocladiopsis]|uniref:HEAT repeat domain-containing protein n=1 Tax=Microdochium trichocladiopsis TaxID=1682393 RepID=A0A9P8XRY7_9PEZI|nr:uncharacterized protein B0I36DRAFT_356598 [Microdochium trichocladiopsis]KAH7010700.1 hypothetical protein B0I36DRAFT_356598 [Microdochium trichocladiopsis]